MSSFFKYATIGFRHRIKELIYRIKYLSWKSGWKDEKLSERQVGIAMIDGRVWHGGICDRFKGIVSFYNYCHYTGKSFRIRYNYPFELTDFLVPNKEDWRIADKDISDSVWHVRPICTRGEKGKRLLKLKTNRQVRFYGNMDLSEYLHFPPFDNDWGVVFNHLFKPSERLQKELDLHRAEIGSDYIAAVFRFQNLLGDFKEYKYKSITDEDYRERMIAANLNEIIRLHDAHPDMRILVTSDSATFLERASELDFVYAIRGEQSHVDTKMAKQSNAIKPFVDFYMIAGAKKAYGVSIDEMYDSDFPVRAAMVGDIPFIRIKRRLNQE